MNDLLTEHRARVLSVEEIIEQAPQVEMDVHHFFADGVYTRALVGKKGVIAVGKIHKFKSTNIIASGDVSVLTDEGVVRYKAPAIFIGEPGAKRVAYFHEDTVWINVHPTHETDLEIIEKQFTTDSFDDPALLQAMIKHLEAA